MKIVKVQTKIKEKEAMTLPPLAEHLIKFLNNE